MTSEASAPLAYSSASDVMEIALNTWNPKQNKKTKSLQIGSVCWATPSTFSRAVYNSVLAFTFCLCRT